MPPSLSELKVLPSFCFAFKIPDDVAASNVYCGVCIWGAWENSNQKPKACVGWAPSKKLVNKKACVQTAHKPGLTSLSNQRLRAYCLIFILFHTLYTTLKLAIEISHFYFMGWCQAKPVLDQMIMGNDFGLYIGSKLFADFFTTLKLKVAFFRKKWRIFPSLKSP